jgi:leader peptidase (prepilin peptidase)/N-methyltransferase
MTPHTTLQNAITFAGGGLAFVPLVQAAAVDIRTRRLPDRLLARSLVMVLAVIVLRVGDGLASAVAGAVALALPLLLAHLVDPSGLGFGDVKLAGVLGALVGLVDWRLAPLALGLACLAALAWVAVRRVRSLAFGPPLVGAAALTVIGGVW